jgi:hypothetical protein
MPPKSDTSNRPINPLIRELMAVTAANEITGDAAMLEMLSIFLPIKLL